MVEEKYRLKTKFKYSHIVHPFPARLELNFPPPPKYPEFITHIVEDLYPDDPRYRKWLINNWGYWRSDGTRRVGKGVRREIARHRRKMMDRWEKEVMRRAEVVWLMKARMFEGHPITQEEAEREIETCQLAVTLNQETH